MTAIQWTDVTDNIIRVVGGGWWCRMISPGCINCYAAKLNQSEFFGGNKLPYTGNPPNLYLDHELIRSWARQRTAKRHFVSSMTDIFGDWVKLGWQFEFLDEMARSPKQTFQLLTKRADVMAKAIHLWLKSMGWNQLPDNIQVGASVENQKCLNERIGHLVSIPAKVHFLSVEPLLEAVDLKNCGEFEKFNCLTGKQGCLTIAGKVQWVIVGGESGLKARSCKIEWIRSVVKQCVSEEVPVFVKQLGAKPFIENWPKCEREMDNFGRLKILELKHPKGGDPLEWPEDLRVREFPA